MCVSHANQILFRALEDEGERQVVMRLAKEMQEQTRRAWVRETRLSINAGLRAFGLSGSLTEGIVRLNEIISIGLSRVFSRVEIARIGATVRGMYTAFKRISVDQLGARFSFRQIDRQATAALAREQPFWMGKFYNSHMSNRIRDLSQKVIIEQGLGRKEAARVMRALLKKDLSWAGGPVNLRGVDLIPARFAGNVGGYSEILVSNVANRGRNMGFLSSFNDAGIEVFRWNSVLDKRTSEVCVFLDGRRFPVSTGMALMDRLVATETPDEVRDVTPWQSSNQLEKTAGSGSQIRQNQNLAEAGIMMPPAHGRCRSVVEAV